jgi:hypothetical protein
MAYAQFDDGFADHPKVRGLGDAAFRLHVAGIVYCSRYLTDGRIMRDDVPDLVRRYRSSALTELVAKGLWLERGTYFEIHDYLQWNDSREVVEARREAKAARQARWLAKANAAKESA